MLLDFILVGVLFMRLCLFKHASKFAFHADIQGCAHRCERGLVRPGGVHGWAGARAFKCVRPCDGGGACLRGVCACEGCVRGVRAWGARACLLWRS